MQMQSLTSWAKTSFNQWNTIGPRLSMVSDSHGQLSQLDDPKSPEADHPPSEVLPENKY